MSTEVTKSEPRSIVADSSAFAGLLDTAKFERLDKLGVPMRQAWAEFSVSATRLSACKWLTEEHIPKDNEHFDSILNTAFATFDSFVDDAFREWTLKDIFHRWFDYSCPKWPPGSHLFWCKYWGCYHNG